MDIGSPRNSYHHGNAREALVSAAREMISEEGLDAVSLRRIAGAVGLDPKAAYRHFDDKQGMLEAVVSRGFAELADDMEDAMDKARASGVLAELEATGVTYVLFACHNPLLFRAMFEIAATSDSSIAGYGRDGRTPYECLELALQNYHSAEQIQVTAEEFVCIRQDLWAAVHGYALLICGGLLKEGEQQIRRAVSRYTAGLALPKRHQQ